MTLKGDDMWINLIAGIIIAGAVIGMIVLIVHFAVKKSDYYGGSEIETPEKKAGRIGERYAETHIRSVMRESDHLFTNFSVIFEGRPAEFDNIIVNSFGVFIIEVKNYSGKLYGSEDDHKWTKVHISKGGNPYAKDVTNPISQLKREVHILANYLRYFGASVWVEGYCIILGTSSPVYSDRILTNDSDIDRAIHTAGKKRLSTEQIDLIYRLLSNNKSMII